jgi:hypothetical protein
MIRTDFWKLFIAMLLALGTHATVAGDREPAAEPSHHEETEAHAEADETPGVVTVDAEALAKSGIVVAPLVSSARQGEQRLAGTVRDRNELLALCRRHAAARERAPELLPALERDARERWGEGIAQGLSGGSPVCTPLAVGQSAVIEVTQPASDSQPLPPTIWLERRQGASEPAQQISLAVKAHPPAQRHTYFLVRDPSDDLMPGQTVTLRFPVEQKQQSVRVPESAVVWLDGKPWFYVQETSGRFVRRELGTQAVAPNERVVMTGAQMLLSQEFRSQIHMEEGSEHEEGEKGEKK